MWPSRTKYDIEGYFDVSGAQAMCAVSVTTNVLSFFKRTTIEEKLECSACKGDYY